MNVGLLTHTRYVSPVNTTFQALLFVVVLQRFYALVDSLKICLNSVVLAVEKFYHVVRLNVCIGVSLCLPPILAYKQTKRQRNDMVR